MTPKLYTAIIYVIFNEDCKSHLFILAVQFNRYLPAQQVFTCTSLASYQKMRLPQPRGIFFTYITSTQIQQT